MKLPAMACMWPLACDAEHYTHSNTMIWWLLCSQAWEISRGCANLICYFTDTGIELEVDSGHMCMNKTRLCMCSSVHAWFHLAVSTLFVTTASTSTLNGTIVGVRGKHKLRPNS